MIDLKVLQGATIRFGAREGVIRTLSLPWLTVSWKDMAESESFLRSDPRISDMEVFTANGWVSAERLLGAKPKAARTAAEAIHAALQLCQEAERVAAANGFQGNPYDISKSGTLKPTRGMKFNYKDGPYTKARTKQNRYDCKCPGNSASGYDCTCKDKETGGTKTFHVNAGAYKDKYMAAWRKFRAQKAR